MSLEPDVSFTFTDLADRLSEHDGAEFAGNTLQRLLMLKETVDREIGKGVGQDVYEGFRAVSEALGSATTIMSLLVKLRAGDGRMAIETERSGRQ
ncbi:MAG: hypothetical protein ACT6U0_14140 [Shinella sp.]|uniref:hypothetical protein n=1 Tax=Shinella sp. TaxID=1870904 RepID=UPI004036FBF0